MRNIFFILILAIVYVISGVFVVNENQQAIVAKGNSLTTYSSGIYWKFPFYGDLEYVDSNIRSSYSAWAQPYKFADNTQINASFVFNWKINNINTYYAQAANSEEKFDAKFAQEINNIILQSAKTSSNLASFINQINSLRSINLPKLGVQVLSVNIVNTKLVQLTNESNGTLTQENAFNQAMQIKESADIAQKNELSNMQRANNQFFTYYMRINSYLESATSKSEVPPLESLIVK